MAKYLTLSGLQTFYTGIKTKLATKVDVVEGKGLSTNDLTDELKAQYDAAVTKATEAERNVVVGIKVNGAAQTVAEDRTVDIKVPTTVAELTDVADYATVAALNDAKTALEESIETTDGKFANYYTNTVIDGKINTLNQAIAAAAVGKITKSVVDSIDVSAKTVTKGEETTAAVENVIYLVPKNPAQTNNVKDEYMLIDGELEKIGDTAIDLSEYAKTADVTSAIAAAKKEATDHADELNTAMDTRVKAVEAATSAIEAITDEEIQQILNS